VEIPPVNKVDQDIYNNYVAIGKEGPRTVSAKDHQLYARYVKAIHKKKKKKRDERKP
jgi:hypothetical protein